MTKKILVTGGSGGAGSYVVHELIRHNYEVRVLDLREPETDVPFARVDLTSYDDVVSATAGFDAIVHFAADPEPDFDLAAGAQKFRNNTLATYNVFNAAIANDLEKVVWASSETVFGFPFDDSRPAYFPVDDEHPLLPQNSYAMSKVLCETLAGLMSQRYGQTFVALRLSNVHFLDPEKSARYELIPSYWRDLRSRKFNLWGYIDARDAATCTRLALEASLSGARAYTVAASDTIMNVPSRTLATTVFPEVPVRSTLAPFGTLLSIDKARAELGFEPRYSWRDVLGLDMTRDSAGRE